VAFDPPSRAFEARLPAAEPAVRGRQIDRLDGRWLIRDGLICTAIAVPAD